MKPEERLLRLLRRVRRRSMALGLVRAAGAAWAVMAASVAVSFVVLPWCRPGAAVGVAAVFAAAGAVAAAGAARRAWLREPPCTDLEGASRRLADCRPGERELLTTGSDLARWGPAGAERRGASPELVEAQVGAAARAAADLAPADVVPAGPALRSLAWAAAATVVLAGVLAWNPGGGVAVWARLVGGGEPEPVSVGNLVITYAPPAYTGLPVERVEGAQGRVEAYPGTRVTLAGMLSRRVDRGTWEGPAGARLPLEMDARRFSVSWIAERSGSYRLRFYEGRKEVPTDFGIRRIALQQDTAPRVELLEPAGDLEVSTDQEIRVRFRAADDFRVEGVEVVLQGDEEVRIPAPTGPGRTVEGEVRLVPLAYPGLGAGAHLRVDAVDGDTVRGPKTGSSRSVYVAFLDRRRLEAQVEDLEERLLEVLLEILADLLEGPSGEDAGWAGTRSRAADVMRLLAELADRVGRAATEGAVGAVAVLRVRSGLEQALGPFAAGAEPSPGLVEELERDILFLDRLLQNLRMEKALTLADEIEALQRELFDRLQAGADPADLSDLVDRVQDMLARLAQQLARGADAMPEAFANADAVQNMPRGELAEQLEALRAALEAGDRERAQELAEQVLQTLARWMAALQEAAQGAQRAEIDPLLAETNALGQEVEALAADQERLLGETRDVGSEVSRRALEELQDELEAFLERQERRLRAAEEAAGRIQARAPRQGFHGGGGTLRPGPDPLKVFELRRRVGAALQEVRSGLREDWARAREALDEAGRAVTELAGLAAEGLEPDDPRRGEIDGLERTARDNLEAVRQDLDGMAERRRLAVGPRQARRLEDLADREAELRDRAAGLSERLRALARRTPLVDDGAAGRLDEAGRAMDEAAGRLGGRDPFGAVPPETRALEHLAEVGRRLREAQGRMLDALQAGGFQVVRRPGGGGRDVDRRPVEIPREMEARELRRFREEVLRAMRSGRYPPGYEDEVERYYERLIR